MNIEINGRICHHRVRALEELANQFQVRKYLEIGVHNGASMSYVLRSKYIEKCVGIDPFESSTDTNSHYIRQDHISEERTLTNLNKNNPRSADITMIKKYSQDAIVSDTDFDMLFIDGDHSYEMVKHDFNKFIRNLRSGGIIVFDDLHQSGPGRFFNDVKGDPRIEFHSIMYETEGVLIKK
jgi:predicted O-methyltransferase YrrM